jgi:large conductance mechanosensitive channel
MKGFRAFLLRGNVLDLAIGIVLGVAFGAVVTALVKDFITPLIAAVFGKPDFSAFYFTINSSRFLYGEFFNAALAFVLIALVIYYFVVLPYAAFHARYAKGEAADPPTIECPECLASIPKAARRCMYCTTKLTEKG